MHPYTKSPPVNDNKQPPLKPQIIGLNQIIIGRLFSFITLQGIILDSYTPTVDYELLHHYKIMEKPTI